MFVRAMHSGMAEQSYTPLHALGKPVRSKPARHSSRQTPAKYGGVHSHTPLPVQPTRNAPLSRQSVSFEHAAKSVDVVRTVVVDSVVVVIGAHVAFTVPTHPVHPMTDVVL